MIDAVFDTNVLASGFAGYTKADSTPGELLRRWRAGRFFLVVSEHILTELERTFANRYFTNRLSPEQIAAALASLRVDARIQLITVQVTGIATQPKDDLVIAAAVSAGARYLVTGDRQLQRRSEYEGILLLSPRQFLDLLESDAA